MAQRYLPGPAHERMAKGVCPECGDAPEEHSSDHRFWVPLRCDLRVDGVLDRIEQYLADEET